MSTNSPQQVVLKDLEKAYGDLETRMSSLIIKELDEQSKLSENERC